MKRFLPLLLTVALLLSCLLAGCKEADSSDETTPEITTPEATTPEENTPKFPPEGAIKLTSVAISTGDTPAEQTAANDLKKYLEQKGVTVTSTGDFPITLSIDASLGEDAYRVTAVVGEGKEESLSIVGGNGRGVLYGVYAYLEKCAEVRFFTPELEVCNPGDVYVWDGVLLDYTPTFELRQTDWYKWRADDSKYNWGAKNGINIINGWTNLDNLWPEELGGSLTYAPGLFVHTIGKLAELDASNPAYAATPCLSDETIYNKVLSNVLKKLEEYPETKILSVSQNDTPKYCECEKCAAIIAEEGSPSGPILRFVNRIAAEVAPLYPNVTIDTMAYDYSLPAPKITKPEKNVCIRLSTINCHFNHVIGKSVNCYNCYEFRTAIKEWGAICENIYVWDYSTNYRYYIATFPNFHVLRENMKFYAENNVKGVFVQGNAQGPSGEFGELRAYLLSKLLMNPYMSKAEYDTHMNEFLAAYYGAGWENILKYIDSYTLYAKYSTDGMGIYSSPLTVLSKKGLADEKDKYNALWDAAEAAAGDRLEYVQRSRLQLRYLLLFVEPNREEARKLIEEVESYKIYWREGHDKLKDDVYSDDSALLDRTPNNWFK